MKKKIILVLSFLMIAMCLSACSTKVTQEKINEMAKIAENIKNSKDYQLPEGYTYELEDNTKSTRRITITTIAETDEREKLKITFDISGDEVSIVQIEETYNNVIVSLLVGIIISLMIIAVVIIAKKSE